MIEVLKFEVNLKVGFNVKITISFSIYLRLKRRHQKVLEKEAILLFIDDFLDVDF
jgi:hypothetical protein